MPHIFYRIIHAKIKGFRFCFSQKLSNSTYTFRNGWFTRSFFQEVLMRLEMVCESETLEAVSMSTEGCHAIQDQSEAATMGRPLLLRLPITFSPDVTGAASGLRPHSRPGAWEHTCKQVDYSTRRHHRQLYKNISTFRLSSSGSIRLESKAIFFSFLLMTLGNASPLQNHIVFKSDPV